MRIAVTREVGLSFGRCELTYVDRQPIDVELARQQHGRYETCLAELGCAIRRMPAEPDLPDSVFVEDVAVVLDELAVLTRLGAPSRRAEARSIAEALAPYRRLVEIEPPATLDGGDVLRIDRTLYVGLSRRTNREGLDRLQRAVGPHGYAVKGVPVDGCLHLKSAVTRVADRAVLIQPSWLPAQAFADLERIEVDPAESFAANALLLDETVIYPAAYPRTRRRLEERGIRTIEVNVAELAKAEGGVTCCSLIFDR